MKKYPRDLFDSKINEFMESEKYKENASQMRKFVDILSEQNLINVMKANKELDYKPVKMLIAYKFASYINNDVKELEKIFSQYV